MTVDRIARLFQDPLILLDRRGRILDMNDQAGALFGLPAPETADTAFAPDGLAPFLHRASGTGEPVLGTLGVRIASGEVRKLRARAIVTHRTPDDLRFAIRLEDSGRDEFSILSRRVNELNQEIARRRAAQVRLESALAENRTLFRELQHRVKNHLQIMLGLFAVARREEGDPGRQAVIEALELKLRAICEAQQLMYMNEADSGIAAPDLLHAMVRVFQRLAGDDARILVAVDDVRVPNDSAFPLALILNELLSNAVRHAGRGAVIEATLRRVDGGLELTVRDDGPGFTAAETGRRASGLGLVRGLCRQLDARIDIANEGGAVIHVRIPDRG